MKGAFLAAGLINNIGTYKTVIFTPELLRLLAMTGNRESSFKSSFKDKEWI